MYDCKIATTNSKKNNIHNNNNNKMVNIMEINENPATCPAKIKNINPETTCNNICPASTLANNRNDKLITLNT